MINTTLFPNGAVLLPEMYIDKASIHTLGAAIAELIASGNVNIIFDLKRVRFIDSVGLGFLVSTLRKVSKKGGNIQLCCLKDEIKGLFKITRLDLVFEIFPSQDEAIFAALSAASTISSESES